MIRCLCSRISISTNQFFLITFCVCSSQEHIPVEEVFQNLKCNPEGLTSDEAQARIVVFGPNKLEEKEVGFDLVLAR